MIYGGNVASNNTGVNALLRNINRKQALDTSTIITQKTMNSQQSNHAEIPQNLQNITPSVVIIPISSSKLFQTFFFLLKNLNNRRLLHKSLQEVEDTIHIPSLYRGSMLLNIYTPSIPKIPNSLFVQNYKKAKYISYKLFYYFSSKLDYLTYDFLRSQI